MEKMDWELLGYALINFVLFALIYKEFLDFLR